MIEINDQWFAAETTHDDLPVFLRGRGKLRDLIGVRSHSNLLRIRWNYTPDKKTGMPSLDVIKKMALFEQVLFESLEKDALCIFYSIYLHNGVKDWSAYCSDLERMNEVLSGALIGHEKYPIELLVDQDPTWEDYQAMLRDTNQL
jgi:hypothetical protein